MNFYKTLKGDEKYFQHSEFLQNFVEGYILKTLGVSKTQNLVEDIPEKVGGCICQKLSEDMLAKFVEDISVKIREVKLPPRGK